MFLCVLGLKEGMQICRSFAVSFLSLDLKKFGLYVVLHPLIPLKNFWMLEDRESNSLSSKEIEVVRSLSINFLLQISESFIPITFRPKQLFPQTAVKQGMIILTVNNIPTNSNTYGRSYLLIHEQIDSDVPVWCIPHSNWLGTRV